MASWLLLVHQIPSKPGYLRVKVGRRLQQIGAVAVKGGVYALPATDQSLEDFQWIRREIVEGGGDASVFRAGCVEGLSDADLQGLFNAARDTDYAALVEEARGLRTSVEEDQASGSLAELARLRERFRRVAEMDWFGAQGRGSALAELTSLEAALRPPPAGESVARTPRGRTWVTRPGVKVDRMASAWLIRRLIDPDASFRFVADPSEARSGELRFDMYEGEYTHEGDRCTFEVLLERFDLDEPSLRALGEIIHDLDLKDGKFGRPEAPGVGALLAGIALTHTDDLARIDAASAALDALRKHFGATLV